MCCTALVASWSLHVLLQDPVKAEHSSADKLPFEHAEPKFYGGQQAMLLMLLLAQRVPTVRSTMARISMSGLVQDVIAGTWPDDITAQMARV